MSLEYNGYYPDDEAEEQEALMAEMLEEQAALEEAYHQYQLQYTEDVQLEFEAWLEYQANLERLAMQSGED